MTDFTGGTFQINANKSHWSEKESFLIFHNINNGTDNFSPEELAMNITIGGYKYKVLNNQFQGEWIFNLNGFEKNSMFYPFIETNQAVTLTISFIENFIREITYSPRGSVTFFVIEDPSVNSTVQYDRNLGCYFYIINTSILDPENYTLRFTFDNENYLIAIKDLNMNVLTRLTLINGTSQLGTIHKEIYALEALNFSFSYLDILKNINIIHLKDTSYTWKMFDDFDAEIDNGIGNLTLNKDIIIVPESVKNLQNNGLIIYK